MRLSDLCHGLTGCIWTVGQIEELPDCGLGEAKLAATPDERKAGKIVERVEPGVARGAIRLRKQPDPLIVPDGRNFAARCA